MCRKGEGELNYFLVHPGGPFYARKNEGVWSIPKGLPEEGEALLETAQREFYEETGIRPQPPFHELGTGKLKSGKVIYAWCFEGEWDPSQGIVSNIFKIEWPPSSKKFIEVPEVDRGEWMSYDKAKVMIHPAQVHFLDRAKEVFTN
jgi:predicted NUDIX family NTP pyrophosphohydrolase